MNWKVKLLREMDANGLTEREYSISIFIFRPGSTDQCVDMAKAWGAGQVG